MSLAPVRLANTPSLETASPILVRGETIGFFDVGSYSVVVAMNNSQDTLVASGNAQFGGYGYDVVLVAGGGSDGPDLGLRTGTVKLNNQRTVAGRFGGASVIINGGQRRTLPGDVFALTDQDSQGKEIVVGSYATGGYFYVWRDGVDDKLPPFNEYTLTR